jgi:YfiH family protein
VGVAPASLATCYQIHSATVVETEAGWHRDARPRADAMVTTRRGVALGILTADCAPVLFADPNAGVIGAAHAGWRGAVSGVLENTLAAMVRHGAHPERITAALGPCIGPASYEVGPDFPAPFIAEDASAARFFAPAARAGHWMFDLPGYVAWRLGRAGIPTVERLAHDTAAEEGRFFSWRRTSLRGEKDYGRLLSTIALV